MKLNSHSRIFALCFFHEQIISSVLVITFNLSLGSTHSYVWVKPSVWSFVQLIAGYTLQIYFPFITLFHFFFSRYASTCVTKSHPCGSMHQLWFFTYDHHFSGFSFKHVFSVQMWPPLQLRSRHGQVSQGLKAQGPWCSAFGLGRSFSHQKPKRISSMSLWQICWSYPQKGGPIAA